MAENYTSEEKAQIKAIKKRLRAAFLDSGMSYYALARKIESVLSFKITENTLKKALNPNIPSMPNMFVVIGVSRILNLDIAGNLAEPTDNDEVVVRADPLGQKGKFIELNEWAYKGVFHGYMNNPNPNSFHRKIIGFELKIEKLADHMQSELTYHLNATDTDGKEVASNPTYRGRPYLMTANENVYMLLSNEKGSIMFLMFKYMEHGTLPMYYRPGIAVTVSPGTKDPLILNFVLFKDEVDGEKTKKYLPGLLRLTDSRFAVEASVIEQYKDDPDVQIFMEELGYIFNNKTIKNDVYWLKDTQIINSIDDESVRESIMKALITLKGHSLAAERITYPYIDAYTRFGKDYLQNKDAIDNYRIEQDWSRE